jgi:pimeloyl-ACP methyl ester carboxylesterase
VSATLLHLHPPGTPSPDALGRRVRVVEREADAGVEPLAVLGSGDACAAALRFAAQAGSRVTALILESPSGISSLAEVSIPTLVVLGTRDASTAPLLGPRGHLVYVYDAGRAISADRPEAFADLVADFVERGEAFVISRSETVIHP